MFSERVNPRYASYVSGLKGPYVACVAEVVVGDRSQVVREVVHIAGKYDDSDTKRDIPRLKAHVVARALEAIADILSDGRIHYFDHELGKMQNKTIDGDWYVHFWRGRDSG